MNVRELREAVEASNATTAMADAFRRALGLPIIHGRRRRIRRDREDYAQLMRQRYGALDRAR